MIIKERDYSVRLGPTEMEQTKKPQKKPQKKVFHDIKTEIAQCYCPYKHKFIITWQFYDHFSSISYG